MWELVTSRQGFADLRSDWESLFARNPRHSPFMSWGWVNAWLTHLGRATELAIICCRGPDKSLQYILPLVKPNNGADRQLCQVMLACSYGPECSEELGCLCLPGLEERAAAMTVEALALHVDGKYTTCLKPLRNMNSYPSDLAEALMSQGRTVRVRRELVCPVVDLPESWGTYIGGLSANFRSQIRRSAKAMQRADEVNCRTLPAMEAHKFAEALMELNRQRMHSKGEVSTLEDKAFRRFLEDAIPYMAEHHTSWMDVIECEEEIVAASLNFVVGGRVYYYMGGFQEKVSKIGPGINLFATAIKRAIEMGCTEYNFLRGAEAYKYRWNASDAPSFSVAIFPERRLHALTASTIDDMRVAIKRLVNKAYE